ncbi:MAG: CPBP family intramembrane metalloprotease [Phycisphaerae bacterium]|nr:CPBP family intramembrane metalloprotease [Phycisphaerae bacterium]
MRRASGAARRRVRPGPAAMGDARHRRRVATTGARGYLSESRCPLSILAFLLPLMLLYEAGSIFYLARLGREGPEPLIAKGMLHRLFDEFGGVSLHLPAIALGVVLLVWHVMERNTWRVRPGTLILMWLESAVWTLPLLVLWIVLATRAAEPGALAMGQDIAGLPWQARLTLSIGAGLYEELLFRLILVTAVHFVAVDLLRTHKDAGYVLAAVTSAVVFAAFHNMTASGGGIDARLLAFYALSGLFLASLFILRGFGIVVGAHAVYDVIALVVVGQS